MILADVICEQPLIVAAINEQEDTNASWWKYHKAYISLAESIFDGVPQKEDAMAEPELVFQ